MIWDARKVSDRVYHRRRLVLATIIGILGLGLVVIRAEDITSGNANAWDFLSMAVWLGMAVYATVVGRYELRAMQASSERGN
jgi:hypothetical protein